MQTKAFPFLGDAQSAPVRSNIPASHGATLDCMRHRQGFVESVAQQRVVDMVISKSSKLQAARAVILLGWCVGKFTMVHSHPQLMHLTTVNYQCLCQPQALSSKARHAMSCPLVLQLAYAFGVIFKYTCKVWPVLLQSQHVLLAST